MKWSQEIGAAQITRSLVRLFAGKSVANPARVADTPHLLVLVGHAFGVEVACAAAQVVVALFSVSFVRRAASALVVAHQVVAHGVDVAVRLARLALVHIFNSRSSATW